MEESTAAHTWWLWRRTIMIIMVFVIFFAHDYDGDDFDDYDKDEDELQNLPLEWRDKIWPTT